MIRLLDTNVLIALVRRQRSAADERVAARFRAVLPGDMAVSSVTVAELWYGAAKSHNPPRRLAVWGELIAATAVAHGHTVVTANVREFARVPGLAVEDWTA